MQFDEASKAIFLEELTKNNKKAIYFYIQQSCCSSTLNVDLTDDGIIEDIDGVPVVFGENAKNALENAKFVVNENGLSLLDLKPVESDSCSCGGDHEDSCSCGGDHEDSCSCGGDHEDSCSCSEDGCSCH